MARAKAKRAAKAKPGKAKGKAVKSAAAKPIELWYWPTPNGFKISIMLEECRLPYTMIPVNISKGEQFKPEFLKIAPNNRMPAIVDPQGPGGQADLDLRVRRHPAISRPQDRQVLSGRRARARRSRPVAVLADGRLRTHGRPAQPLPALRARDAALRHQALRGRGQPALRRDEQAARRTANSSPAAIRSPTWPASAGPICGSGRTRTSTISRTSSAGWRRVKARPAVQRGMKLGLELRQGIDMKDPNVQAVLFGQRARAG